MLTFDEDHFRKIFVQLCQQSADALEGESLEIKGWCNSEKDLTEKIADAASCLANAQGGVLLVGIEDGMGPNRFRACPYANVSPTWLVSKIQDNTRPPVSCTAFDVSDQLADVMGVATANAFAVLIERKRCLSGHSTAKGISRARNGKECKPLFTTEDDRTRAVVPDATPNDLSSTSMQFAVAHHHRKFPSEEPFAGVADFLARSGLAYTDERNGAECVTLAALLLFGKESALRKHSISCETVLAFPGSVRSFRQNIIESLRELIVGEHSFLKSLLPAVPEPTLRELLVNAYIHRCWRTNGPVSIAVSESIFEVQNPGGLLSGLTTGNILYGVPVYRNLCLADGMRYAGLSDKIGQGIDIVFKTVLAGGFDFPIFDNSNDCFRAAIPLTRSEEFRDFVRRRASSLPQLDDILVLRYLWGVGRSDFKHLTEVLQRGSELARRRIREMQDKNMIETENGYFRLSDSILSDIGSYNPNQLLLDLSA